MATVRVLFKKISKGINQQDFQLVQHKRRIEQLEARVVQLAPRKRHKVVTSPNSKFADIEAIKRAQILAGDKLSNRIDLDEFIELTSTLSCIIIEE